MNSVHDLTGVIIMAHAPIIILKVNKKRQFSIEVNWGNVNNLTVISICE